MSETSTAPSAVRRPRAEASDLAELVAAAREGDQLAWRTLVERITPLLWGVTRSFRLDHATRADVVQAAWVALAEHLDSVREPQALAGWLASTVRRACLHELNRRGRVELRDGFAERDVVDHGPAPEQQAAAGDRDRRLWRAVSRLPERDQRLLVLLASNPPIRYSDIATILQIPVGSIGPTRARCLGRLRVQLVAEGIADSTALAG